MSILTNKAQCLKCGDIIESKYRHDYVECSCGAIFVDGGQHYLHRGYKQEYEDCFIELSEFIDDKEKD